MYVCPRQFTNHGFYRFSSLFITFHQFSWYFINKMISLVVLTYMMIYGTKTCHFGQKHVKNRWKSIFSIHFWNPLAHIYVTYFLANDIKNVQTWNIENIENIENNKTHIYPQQWWSFYHVFSCFFIKNENRWKMVKILKITYQSWGIRRCNFLYHHFHQKSSFWWFFDHFWWKMIIFDISQTYNVLNPLLQGPIFIENDHFGQKWPFLGQNRPPNDQLTNWQFTL